MSAPFLITSGIPNMRIAVEIAFGADLTDLTGASWTWTDITSGVILDGSKVVVTLGRPDFSSETQAAEMTCELDNRDGEWSEGGMSPHWPNVRRGTPIRVHVSNDGGTTWFVRFQGAVVGFTPHWDRTGRWATATLTASGPLRRLNQGTLPAKSVYTTEIPRSSGWDGLFLYWPCESGDGVKSNSALVPSSGHPVLKLDTNYTPKATNNPSNAAFPFSGPYQSHFKMFAGQAYTGGETIPAYSNTGILQVRMLVAIPGAFPTPQVQPLLFIRTSNSTVRTWSLQINEGGALRLVGINSSDSIVRTGSTVAFNMNGTARLVSVTLDNNGSSLDTRISTLRQETGIHSVWDETFSSTNIGTLTGIDPVGPDFSPDGTSTENGLIAHVTVQNTATSMGGTATKNVFLGMPGEASQDRIARLCANHNIALDTLIASQVPNSSITDGLGPQYYDTLTNLLRECERTGQGYLFDGLGPGLTYVTKRRREVSASDPAALVLDAAQGHLVEPFDVIADDQQVVNHCDVSIRNGASVGYIEEGGPVGAEAIGDYATSYTVNPDTDGRLIHYAEWTVGIGAQQGYRYPSVSFALERHSALIAGWLACIPTSRIDVENIVSIRRQHPDYPIRLLLEGWTEEIDQFEWHVTANTSAQEPWNVVVLAAATGSTGDGICHMDTDSSQLNANAAQGATSISVRTNSGPRWVSTGEDADSFPFDVDLGGIKATVTAISGTSSPQTFTLADPLPRAFTGSTTSGAGTPVKVWRPPVFGL